MKVVLLGTGTSHGVPEIGCTCVVCTSPDTRDRRLRTSAWIETDMGDNILIDCGPDFRTQALTIPFCPLAGVLLTHEHYDHVAGLDDLRMYSSEHALPVYSDTKVEAAIRERIPYCFAKPRYPGTPHISLNVVHPLRAFTCGNTEILPLFVLHGNLPILGYRIGSFAYITDCRYLPEESLNALKGISHLVINALHFKPHASHQSVAEALELIADIQRITDLQATYLTHVTHRIGLHEETNSILPPDVHLGYDGLMFSV